MRDALLDYLCCPLTRSPLALEDAERDAASGDILAGALVSPEQRRYPIRDGVPHLALEFRDAREAQTVTAFGRQWQRFERNAAEGSPELFCDYSGLTPDQVRGRTVLEVGCGAGRWLKVIAGLGARQVVGLDYSSGVVQARRRTLEQSNVHVVRGSALDMPLLPKFDLAISIGVVHTLADPVLGLKGIRRAVTPSHLVAIWVYAREGNEMYLRLVRPLRFLGPRLPDGVLFATSRALTVGLFAYIHSVNRLAVGLGLRLPLRDYLAQLSAVRFRDVEYMVYDQLTPSIARYPSRQEVQGWIHDAGAEIATLDQRTGNSWRSHLCFARP